MRIKIAPFEGDLTNLGSRVVESIKQLEHTTLEPESLSLIGPIPVYVADLGRFADGNTEDTTTQSGWRGLIVADDRPVALVDIAELQDMNGKRGRCSFNVRGKEAAFAFFKTLEMWERVENEYPSKRVVEGRFLTLPSLHVTALWLKGDASFYIPTRTGHGFRPEPTVMNESEFADMVSKRLEVKKKHLLTSPSSYEGEDPINSPPGSSAKRGGPRLG